jgi:hypothetical protein
MIVGAISALVIIENAAGSQPHNGKRKDDKTITVNKYYRGNASGNNLKT